MGDSDALRAGLATVRSQIDAACRRAGRDPGTVVLVAVTKTFPIEVIQMARAAGHDEPRTACGQAGASRGVRPFGKGRWRGHRVAPPRRLQLSLKFTF